MQKHRKPKIYPRRPKSYLRGLNIYHRRQKSCLRRPKSCLHIPKQRLKNRENTETRARGCLRQLVLILFLQTSRRGAAKRILTHRLKEAKGLESSPTIEIKNKQNLNPKKRPQNDH